MNTKVIKAAPGTYVIWFNHCREMTIREPALFWISETDEDDCTFIYPATIRDGVISKIYLPERVMEGREEEESVILGYDIPGYGRIDSLNGAHREERKGWVTLDVWNEGNL